jgi:hypothetical protein
MLITCICNCVILNKIRSNEKNTLQHATKEKLKVEVTMVKILWHVDELLGNNREISNYTTAVGKYWLCKQRTLLGNG